MAFKTAASWLRERFALGSAAAPSITFAGDTNTGLYSPGADQVGIATAGTAAVVVNATGQVGVGLTSLSSKLHIYDASSAQILVQGDAFTQFTAQRNSTDSSGPTFSLIKRRGSTASPSIVSASDVLGSINFNGYDGSGAKIGASIIAEVDATPGANDMPGRLLFYTTADGASSVTERLRIDSTGQLTTGTGSATAPVLSFSGDTNTGVYSPGADQVAIATAGTAILYVVAAGNVGIGTATPSSKLDVSGTITSTALTVGGASVGPSVTVNTQGTAYTLALTDAGKVVEVSNAAAVDVTVPPNSSVAFPVGSRIDILQTGAGQVTIKAGSGVTVNANGGNLKIKGQWAAATVIKRATDTWVAVGNLVA